MTKTRTSVQVSEILQQHEPKPHRISGYVGTVSSSHGELMIAADGRVIDYQPCGDDEDSVNHLKTIVRFNVVEYLKTYNYEDLPMGFDILDLGYWYKSLDGEDRLCHKYEPPAYDWRREHGIAYDQKEG